MLAFQKAAETGCHGIELDVQLTKDGQLVVIHDETTDRTTNVKGRVRDFSLEGLRQLDASFRFGSKFGFTPIPTLGEYFDFVCDSPIVTNIELKNGIYDYPDLEDKLVSLVREYRLTDKVIFSSFNHQSLLKCKRLCPGTEIAFIISCWMISAGSYCEDNKGDYLNARSSFLTPENLADLQAHGIRAQAWTVDDPMEMERLMRLGVCALITNEPERAMRVLGQ